MTMPKGSFRTLLARLWPILGDPTRILRLVDRQAGAASTGWAVRALHISQAGARRPLYPSWAAMITSADGPSRASPDFPHIPVPLGCNKTPLGRTLLRRVPRQAPPKLAKVELREQLAKAGPSLPERPGESTRSSPNLPRDEEVDRALGYIEKFLRRFMGILRDETGKPI